MHRARPAAWLAAIALVVCSLAPGTVRAEAALVPLPDRVEEADAVVLARVARVDRCRCPHGHRVTTLQLRAVLKGDVGGEELRVRDDAEIECPAPPAYEANQLVVAFLRRTDDGWRTYAFDQGRIRVGMEYATGAIPPEGPVEPSLDGLDLDGDALVDWLLERITESESRRVVLRILHELGHDVTLPR